MTAYLGAGLQPVIPVFRAVGDGRVRDVLQPPARRPPAALLRPPLRPDRLGRHLRRRPAAEPARHAPPCRRRKGDKLTIVVFAFSYREYLSDSIEI